MRVIASLARVLWRDRRGATAVEYGMIVAVIVIAMMISLAPVADRVVDIWNNAAKDIKAAIRL
ncbi:Flp family type IVb pilin [Sphingomonas sp. PL-96]|uniref:Flp family type IVb pilin n=1 Tax=Sphingomonas sp. PL-96 TaxID=2887201 RepID=UPI001E306153|nr:Flp family type IVb pilin [Sphingomonas sp. PL-96]MCC2976375.1 Flp family type IVb pilin [Sphingomonas sp. PL-96]